MARIAEAFVEITARTGKLRQGLDRAVSATRRAGAAMAGIARAAGRAIAIGFTAGILAIALIIPKITKAFNIQNDAEVRLAATLKQFDGAIGNNLTMLKRQASAIQQVTTFGDEYLLGVMASMRALGVQTDQIGTATKVAIGLSKATGINVETAGRYVAMAKQGETTMLRRYIPALRQAESAQEALNIVTKLGLDGFAVAQAEAETLSGKWEGLLMASGDLAESLGKVVFGGDSAQEMLKGMTEAVARFAAGVGNSAGSIREIFKITLDLFGNFREMIITGMAGMMLDIEQTVRNSTERILKGTGNFLIDLTEGITGNEAGAGSHRRLLNRATSGIGVDRSDELRLLGADARRIEKNLDDLLANLNQTVANARAEFRFGQFNAGRLPGDKLTTDEQEQAKQQTKSAAASLVSTIASAFGAFKVGQNRERELIAAQVATRRATENTADQTTRAVGLLGDIALLLENNGITGAFEAR